MLAHHGARKVVAAVGDALYLADNVEHRRDTHFAFIAQSAVDNAVEVVGYLYLHAVGDFLIFADARKKFVELLGLGLDVAQRLDHAEHTVDAVGVDLNLSLCLGNVELGGVEHASGDVFELELVLFFVLGLDEEVADFHVVFGQPNHDDYVDKVEYRVENRQSERHCGCAGDDGIAWPYLGCDGDYKRNQWVDENQCPHGAEAVEKQMPEGGFLCRGVTAEGGENWGDCGADVASEHHRAAHLKRYPALAAHNHHDGKRRCRRLDYHGDDDADKHEDHHRRKAHIGVMGKEFERVGVKLGHVLADELQA